jgi:hypothetical protein
MNSKPAQSARNLIDDFCWEPTRRQQLATLVVAGCLMLAISATLAWLDLI